MSNVHYIVKSDSLGPLRIVSRQAAIEIKIKIDANDNKNEIDLVILKLNVK